VKRFTILLMLIAALVLSSSAQADPARCFKVIDQRADAAIDTFEITGYENGDYVLGIVVHTDIATSSVAAVITFRTAIADTLLEMTIVDEVTAGPTLPLDTSSGQMPFAVGHFPGITAAASQDYCIGDRLYIIYDPKDANAGWVTVYVCVKRD